MPLDGHGHLVKQGWSGKGTGLRNGAIAKPITVIQKKTLAGIGKDRDEAFPFWDQSVPSLCLRGLRCLTESYGQCFPGGCGEHTV